MKKAITRSLAIGIFTLSLALGAIGAFLRGNTNNENIVEASSITTLSTNDRANLSVYGFGGTPYTVVWNPGSASGTNISALQNGLMGRQTANNNFWHGPGGTTGVRPGSANAKLIIDLGSVTYIQGLRFSPRPYLRDRAATAQLWVPGEDFYSNWNDLDVGVRNSWIAATNGNGFYRSINFSWPNDDNTRYEMFNMVRTRFLIFHTVTTHANTNALRNAAVMAIRDLRFFGDVLPCENGRQHVHHAQGSNLSNFLTFTDSRETSRGVTSNPGYYTRRHPSDRTRGGASGTTNTETTGGLLDRRGEALAYTNHMGETSVGQNQTRVNNSLHVWVGIDGDLREQILIDAVAGGLTFDFYFGLGAMHDGTWRGSATASDERGRTYSFLDLGFGHMGTGTNINPSRPRVSANEVPSANTTMTSGNIFSMTNHQTIQVGGRGSQASVTTSGRSRSYGLTHGLTGNFFHGNDNAFDFNGWGFNSRSITISGDHMTQVAQNRGFYVRLFAEAFAHPVNAADDHNVQTAIVLEGIRLNRVVIPHRQIQFGVEPGSEGTIYGAQVFQFTHQDPYATHTARAIPNVNHYFRGWELNLNRPISDILQTSSRNPEVLTYYWRHLRNRGIGHDVNGLFATIAPMFAPIPLTATSFVYNGNPQGSAVNLSALGNGYSVVNPLWSGETTMPTNAGDYTFTADLFYGSYHIGSVNRAFTIAKAPFDFDGQTTFTKQYGETITLPNGEQFTATSIGSFTKTVTVIYNENHLSAEVPVTIVVTPRPSSESAFVERYGSLNFTNVFGQPFAHADLIGRNIGEHRIEIQWQQSPNHSLINIELFVEITPAQSVWSGETVFEEQFGGAVTLPDGTQFVADSVGTITKTVFYTQSSNHSPVEVLVTIVVTPLASSESAFVERYGSLNFTNIFGQPFELANLAGLNVRPEAHEIPIQWRESPNHEFITIVLNVTITPAQSVWTGATEFTHSISTATPSFVLPLGLSWIGNAPTLVLGENTVVVRHNAGANFSPTEITITIYVTTRVRQQGADIENSTFTVNEITGAIVVNASANGAAQRIQFAISTNANAGADSLEWRFGAAGGTITFRDVEYDEFFVFIRTAACDDNYFNAGAMTRLSVNRNAGITTVTDGGMGTGAIVGTVVGVCGALGLAGLVGTILFKRRGRNA
ncbi:MAG: hypothetical protein FWC00_02575 [Firmicutes bacterium]|nr:hypothetical protein [Bacillota bacterium]